MIKNQIIVSASDTGKRIDIYLADNFPDYSRSYFSNLITDNEISVNNLFVKPSYRLKNEDFIKINFKEITVFSDPRAENIPLDIIFENNDVIVLNKEPGIVVHPSAGHESNTIVNALINHLPNIKKAIYDKNSLISKIRPGIVHRLDKDTSGVMIVAKNARTMHSLSKQIQNRSVNKVYIGLCLGWPNHETGELISFLGRDRTNRKLISNIGEINGKKAILKYKVIDLYKDKYDNKICLLEFDLKTGRTHQIRVQSRDMGNPILGDTFYSNKISQKVSSQNGVNRQMLHAQTLSICLPGDTKKTFFSAPIPKDFLKTLKKLKKIVSR